MFCIVWYVFSIPIQKSGIYILEFGRGNMAYRDVYWEGDVF